MARAAHVRRAVDAGRALLGRLARADRRVSRHHAAIEPRRSQRAINVGEFQFISENSQIDLVRGFMASLSSTLTG
jgi:hypothetical protein